jgi:hypothetical protein
MSLNSALPRVAVVGLEDGPTVDPGTGVLAFCQDRITFVSL